ncbi:MAG TPA: PQ-loop domain-containing transporter [Candidatus Saccharimonadales bacterium]|nr:PQ-loop domain-containing transporter [Candidatus Saccharimonadales bacterium]
MIVQPTLLENALIVVGEGAWVLSAAAQLRRLARTGNTRGLSAPSQTLNAAGNVGWCTYFGINHLWFPFFTNILVLMLGIAILGYILSNHKQFVRGLIAIAIIGPVTSYVLIHNPGAGGWLGMLYNWMAGTPQLMRIVRRKKVSGLSEKGLYLATIAMTFTLTYGLLIHSLPLVAGCIQGLTYMWVTMMFYYRHRHSD